jgi:acyl-CoA dehydrogenase
MSLDSESIEVLVATVRRFVRERLLPIENQVAEEGRIPDAIIHDMCELGLYGLSIPEIYGGTGLNMEEEVRVVRSADSGVAGGDENGNLRCKGEGFRLFQVAGI